MTLREALSLQRLDAESILDLAREHELCPFELSLDISETADVVICDYNYVFDPKVRLRRFFDGKSRAGLLVDEAHNLADRARDMLSAELSGARAAAVRELALRFEGSDSPMGQLLGELLDALEDDDAEPECSSDMPGAVVEAARRFAEIAVELEPVEPELVDFVYGAQWFARVSKQFDPDAYRALTAPEGKRLNV